MADQPAQASWRSKVVEFDWRKAAQHALATDEIDAAAACALVSIAQSLYWIREFMAEDRGDG